uniref:Uncharacterized protein n=1 Tax=Arundo donax TaxID=35708 RepID=A0A0A9ETI3_ARUDO
MRSDRAENMRRMQQKIAMRFVH